MQRRDSDEITVLKTRLGVYEPVRSRRVTGLENFVEVIIVERIGDPTILPR